jgi:hypothetical protein
LLVDFENHGGDQLNQITADRGICRGWLDRQTNIERWSAGAKAAFYPALHALTL